jgi:carbonic anhydrase
MSYQSPIHLNKKDAIYIIPDNIIIEGTNNGALYNKKQKIFKLKDTITMKIHNKNYKLIEYHFHIPSEHTIDDIVTEAEIHYVFNEILDKDKDFDFYDSDSDSSYSGSSGSGSSGSYHRRRYRGVTCCDNKSITDPPDIECCNKLPNTDTANILVVAKLIKNKKDTIQHLKKISFTSPICYYEYDGLLTTDDDFSPVRWLIDDDVMDMDLTKIIPIAKTAKSIQKLDGRIILYNQK